MRAAADREPPRTHSEPLRQCDQRREAGPEAAVIRSLARRRRRRVRTPLRHRGPHGIRGEGQRHRRSSRAYGSSAATGGSARDVIGSVGRRVTGCRRSQRDRTKRLERRQWSRDALMAKSREGARIRCCRKLLSRPHLRSTFLMRRKAGGCASMKVVQLSTTLPSCAPAVP